MKNIFRNTTPPRPAGTRQEPRRSRVCEIRNDKDRNLVIFRTLDSEMV